MNFSITNKGIASGLAVSALVTSFPDQAESTELGSHVDANSVQSLEVFPHPIIHEISEDEITDNTYSLVIDIPSEPTWDKKFQTRFEELVGMIALGEELSESDLAEYANLKNFRSRTHPSRTFDEIVADQELHRKVSEAIKSIKTLIDYATSSFPAAAKTNRP